MEGPYRRRRYSREFKLDAVRHSQEPGKTVAEVARELDLRENDLHDWRAKVAKHGEGVFPGSGRKQSTTGLAHLKAENRRLEEENRLLKKAAIYFARASTPSTDS